MFNKTKANEMLSASLAGNLAPVKPLYAKFGRFLIATFTGCAAMLLSVPAQAEDANTRAMLNSQQLVGLLEGVLPPGLPNVLQHIRTNRVQRIAPQYPVWLLEAEGSTILYYQGQPTFTGQNATRLVDDNGFRFGQRALEQALKGRSTWLMLTLGGVRYSAYCATRLPYVACSLLVP